MSSLRQVGFPHKQRGVALITVLLVFALVAIIAGEIVNRVYFSIRQTGNHLIYAQAYQYALGGEAFARQLLYKDFELDQQRGAMDHLHEAWFKQSERYDFDQGILEISIRDMQDRLNVNNLITPEGEPDQRRTGQFQRLFQELKLDSAVLSAWLDWLDKDLEPRFMGLEDEGYLALDRSYRAANQAIAEISELLAVKGMNKTGYEKLLPSIAALPSPTAINVNTVTAQVLAAMVPNLGLAAAERIVEGREESGYETVDDFMQHEQLAGLELDASDFTVQSEYFEVTVRSEFAGREVWLKTLLYRDPQKGVIRLLYRDRSGRFEVPTENKSTG